MEGKTFILRADGSGDFPTIQAAIDASEAGDEIVLEPGTYTGYGNRNLNYRGKPITIRSRNPFSDTCMFETIIDAEGHGVIVKFINDEGPESVFEGFTLGAGDTSQYVRGEVGFFEFSRKARPTTRRLRNKPPDGLKALGMQAFEMTQLSSSFCDPNYPGFCPPLDGRAWSG